MIFGRRFQYPLPKFPVTVIPAFRQLCRDIGVEHLEEVRGEVERCLNGLREKAADKPNLNLPLAEEVAGRCFVLLDHFEELKQRVLGEI